MKTALEPNCYLTGELARPSNSHTTRSSTSDEKEVEDVEKLSEDETGKMIDEERSETGRVRSLVVSVISCHWDAKRS